MEFVPGPVYCKQRGFVLAYEAMCERAGRTLADVVEERCAGHGTRLGAHSRDPSYSAEHPDTTPHTSSSPEALPDYPQHACRQLCVARLESSSERLLW